MGNMFLPWFTKNELSWPTLFRESQFSWQNWVPNLVLNHNTYLILIRLPINIIQFYPKSIFIQYIIERSKNTNCVCQQKFKSYTFFLSSSNSAYIYLNKKIIFIITMIKVCKISVSGLLWDCVKGSPSLLWQVWWPDGLQPVKDQEWHSL